MGKYDEIWKQIIENLFRHFMYFYLPDLAVDVDFDRGYQFLDKEFQTIQGRAKDRRRKADKLIKVHLKDGRDQWILVHLEVQYAKEDDFPERMFKYFYRIYDKYNRKIVSLVIFTGESKSYPLKFDYNFYKTRLLYSFRFVKLVKYKEKLLLEDKNPFALVTLAVKYALKSKTDEELRARFTVKLIRLMKKRGYSDEEIINLLRFIDIMLEVTNEELTRKIHRELEKFQEEGHIMILTKFEQKALEKGKEEEKMETARRMLKKKLDKKIIIECTGLREEVIDRLRNEKQ